MNSSNDSSPGALLPVFRSQTSALKAFNRAEACYQARCRKLHRIAQRDACPGDLFVGWDWPTLRICRPDDYAALNRFAAEAREAAAWVRWFAFVPAAPMEFQS